MDLSGVLYVHVILSLMTVFDLNTCIARFTSNHFTFSVLLYFYHFQLIFHYWNSRESLCIFILNFTTLIKLFVPSDGVFQRFSCILHIGSQIVYK